MNKKKQTYSIRGKLVSAVCMLLVAIIMVVSSTYAWFTLSTAPEVTGMQTAIGANGALEMALWDGNDPLNAMVGGMTTVEKNGVWGNLVDLSSEDYGLNKIVLYPSQLNVKDGKIQTSPLAIPVYGADGRVSELDDKKTLAGLYDTVKNGFYEGNGYGVRGVGSASGMTDRQLAYRDAKSQAANATAAAKSKAAAVLNEKGSALANIALSYGMNGANATFTKTDVVNLRYLIDGLKGTDGAVSKIETAYKYYIAAFATSALGPTDDLQAMAVYNTATDSNKTLKNVIDALADNGVELPEELDNAIEALNDTIADVTAADAALVTLETGMTDESTFTWAQISLAMTPLASTGDMLINGFTVSEAKENLGGIVSSITEKGGLTVSMASGAGVFADIADHCGDYTASVTIEEVEYNGIKLNNMKARMATATSLPVQYLPACGLVAEDAGAPAGAAGGDMPISEFYGYIIDMAFRTNAAESNLLLQTEATDRIYKGNNNEETLGHGATMSFKSTDTGFDNDKIKALMGSIRVVFFTPDTSKANLGTVLVYAKLDMSKAFINEDSAVEAPLVLYTETTTVTYTKDTDGNYLKADGSPAYYFNAVDGKYYAEAEFTTEVAEADMTDRASTTTTSTTILTGDDAVITALPQNLPVVVSALVYLDGNSITNASVSATGTQSMTGKMNLQFSSSANLVPMEYADLHTPNAGN